MVPLVEPMFHPVVRVAQLLQVFRLRLVKLITYTLVERLAGLRLVGMEVELVMMSPILLAVEAVQTCEEPVIPSTIAS